MKPELGMWIFLFVFIPILVSEILDLGAIRKETLFIAYMWLCKEPKCPWEGEVTYDTRTELHR